MRTIAQLTDMDVFFNYGEPGSDLSLESESDLVIGLFQPRRSLFYNRRWGAGIQEYENHPNQSGLDVTMRFLIASFVGIRNNRVSQGQNNLPDRRLAASQNSIRFVKNGTDRDVEINYFEFDKLGGLNVTSVPIGRTL